MPSFKVTRVEAALIRRRIAARAFHSLQALSGDGRGVLDLQRDITLCHANGCRLALEELLGAGDVPFAHDVTGIVRGLDRATGTIGDFSPRFAVEGPLARRARNAAARQRSFRRNRLAAAALSQVA